MVVYPSGLQIENIQRVIKVTRKKLEEMNEEFGKHQHPPSIYVQVSTSNPLCTHQIKSHSQVTLVTLFIIFNK